jgi:hypothetical protein
LAFFFMYCRCFFKHLKVFMSLSNFYICEEMLWSSWMVL